MMDLFDRHTTLGRHENPFLEEPLLELPIHGSEAVEYGITSGYIEECARFSQRMNVVSRLLTILMASPEPDLIHEIDDEPVLSYGPLLAVGIDMQAANFGKPDPNMTFELLDIVLQRAEAEIIYSAQGA
jgi:hypothetical protein